MAVVKPHAFELGAKSVYNVPDPHVGPTAYTQVTTGPLAGGDSCSANEFGLKWLIKVEGGFTSDGLYQVQPINAGGSVTKTTLRWVVVATGLQVAPGVNLSGSSVTLSALGF